MSELPKVSISDLLDAGVHFGHKASRWNPKMEPYIYGVRDDIHVIDLQQTAPLLQVALNKIYEVVKNNGKVLFVSSKIQATGLIAECANKCGQYHINHRWLGGILTNWITISKSIKKLDNIEKTLSNEDSKLNYTKKELLDLTRRKEKLLRSFDGIRNINGCPDLMVIIDTNKERLAIKEAVKLSVPIVAIVDSNSNPDNIDFPIPGNDDAVRSIRLYCSLFADAALAGIQDSLKDSGVDVGAIAEGKMDNSMNDVKEIKKSEKFSKSSKGKSDSRGREEKSQSQKKDNSKREDSSKNNTEIVPKASSRGSAKDVSKGSSDASEK